MAGSFSAASTAAWKSAPAPIFVRTAATATPDNGHYSSTFTLPYAGNWTIDIVSGWASGASGSRLAIQAIEPEARVPVVTETERGQRLFTAKGCVTCHIHGAVEGLHISSGAPELTSKRYPPQYLNDSSHIHRNPNAASLDRRCRT